MRLVRLSALVLTGVIAVGTMVACGSTPDSGEAADGAELVERGSWFVREPWPHDGSPVEGESFVVYSDAAGAEARRRVAETADDVWAELLVDFSITPGSLLYPEGQDKLHIYAYRNHDPRDWEARAYYGGLIIWSPDHNRRQDAAGTRLAPVLKHELVHVLHWLISGRPESNPVDVWFLEGLPEAVSGGTTGGAIRGLDELDDLTDEYGAISPISVKTYSQIASPDAGENFHYPMFQLAVEYLMDEDGRGRSLTDARDVLIDVAEGATFEAAFEDRMGIPLVDYEREFFDLMAEYLPQYRNPMFSPVGFGLLSVVVILFVIGLPAVGYRRWWAGASAGDVGSAAPGRAARIAFFTETAVAGAIIIVFFLGALFVLGTFNPFNNAMYTTGRTRAYWILVGYLLASVGVVGWAVHRWVGRSRLAFLVAPIVIIATAVTAAIATGAVI